MTLSLDSFALKVIKKAEELAFSNKAKIININIPEKVKVYVEKNLSKQINYFDKKYKIELNLISDKNLILPEYKMNLLNKNKKIIKKIENIENIESSFVKQDYNTNKFKNGLYNKKFLKRSKFKKKYKFAPKKMRKTI